MKKEGQGEVSRLYKLTSTDIHLVFTLNLALCHFILTTNTRVKIALFLLPRKGHFSLVGLNVSGCSLLCGPLWHPADPHKKKKRKMSEVIVALPLR